MNALCNEILATIEQNARNARPRSAWTMGVQRYAMDLIYILDEIIEFEKRNPANVDELEKWMLNGASSWKEYSLGGCSLIYDRDIARRLCTPSELKKTRNGERKPNRNEEWIDTQARALHQAADLIRYIYVNITATATEYINN